MTLVDDVVALVDSVADDIGDFVVAVVDYFVFVGGGGGVNVVL